MLKVERFTELLDTDFYTGVPDSQLRALCDYLMDTYGIDPEHHMIAANEGNCTAIAAGYHLATGKIPVVYMQNSGEGNVINPVASLLNREVYGIPVIFIIGWRGEPGVHDEPQHVYQGMVTARLLDDMDISHFTVGSETTESKLIDKVNEFRGELSKGNSVAFIIRKGALSYEHKTDYKNENDLNREDVIRHIINTAEEDIVVSTTGKISRELFELRTANGQSHNHDFLTVGSMGHSSSIALGIAINKPSATIWCIDGDGAVLMHMGALALLGANAPANLIHIVINNGAHETVGGMPTANGKISIAAVASACGYPYAVCVDTYQRLDEELKNARTRQALSMIEVKCSLGARNNLGRPTTSARKNKESFMNFLNTL